MHVKRVNHNLSNPVSMPSTVIPLLSVRQHVYPVFKSQSLRYHCSLTFLDFKQIRTDVTCILFNRRLFSVFLVLWSDRRGITLLTRALGAATPQCWRHAEKRREDLCTFPTFHILFFIGGTALCGALGREIETDKNIQDKQNMRRERKLILATLGYGLYNTSRIRTHEIQHVFDSKHDFW